MIMCGVRIVFIANRKVPTPNLDHHYLNPKPPPPYSKLMLGLPTQSGNDDGEEERRR